MNVTIVSAFRNAVDYIPRYFDQIQALRKLLFDRGDWLNLLLGYGDSTDGTGEMLFEETSFAIGAQLVEVSHGGPHFGSIEDAQRFRQLACVGNKLWAAIPPDADVVALVESDLIWEADVIARLINMVAVKAVVAPPSVVMAPMVMDGRESFYDVFAFRRNGVRFTKTPPYHADLPVSRDAGWDYLELDSAGSVLVMDGDVARAVRFTEDEVVVGMCKQIYQYGGSVWLDPQLTVFHVA